MFGIGEAMAGIGAIGSIYSAIQGNKAQNQMIGALNKQTALGRDQLAFNRTMSNKSMNLANERMQFFQDIFGDPMKNYANYVKNLDPESFATRMNAQTDKAYAQAIDKVNEFSAQHGITGSGIQGQFAKEAAFNAAEAKVNNAYKAEEYVQNVQGNFANSGLNAMNNGYSGIQQAINVGMNGVNTGYNSMMNAQGNLANGYGNVIQSHNQDAAGFGQLLGYGLSQMK